MWNDIPVENREFEDVKGIEEEIFVDVEWFEEETWSQEDEDIIVEEENEIVENIEEEDWDNDDYPSFTPTLAQVQQASSHFDAI